MNMAQEPLSIAFFRRIGLDFYITQSVHMLVTLSYEAPFSALSVMCMIHDIMHERNHQESLLDAF